MFLFWVLLKVTYCVNTMHCSVSCENVRSANQFSCLLETWSGMDGPNSLLYYSQNTWMVNRYDTIFLNNNNNCSVSVPVPKEVFATFSKLAVLHMNNSNIEEIFRSDFQYADYLKNVSLSNNTIENLPSLLFGASWRLLFVDLSFNKIKNISADAFEKYNDNPYVLTPQLESYWDPDEYAQDKIKFESKFLNIENLHLDNNLIEYLDPKVFSSLENLKILTLNNNHLKEVDVSVSFGRNKNLARLHLNTNRITKAKFSNIPLKFFNISDNPLSENSFPSDCVSNAVRADISTTNIKTLIIGNQILYLRSRHNKIEQFYPLHEFSNNSLAILDITNNSLNSLRNITFFTNLTSFDVAHNLIQTLDQNVFVGLHRLQHLNLSENQLTEFDIHFPESLQILDISYNRLRQFSVNVTLDNLQQLYIEGNHLTTIDSSITLNIPNLQIMSIENNDWSCKYLTRKMLVLSMYDVKITYPESGTHNRNYDSAFKGIGCYNNGNWAESAKRKDRLKKEIEAVIDQRLMKFEITMSALIEKMGKNLQKNDIV